MIPKADAQKAKQKAKAELKAKQAKANQPDPETERLGSRSFSSGFGGNAPTRKSHGGWFPFGFLRLPSTSFLLYGLTFECQATRGDAVEGPV